MKRIVCAILFVLLFVGASHAQESSTWSFTTFSANRVKGGVVDLTKEKSEKTIAFQFTSLRNMIQKGDSITRISFPGYNPEKDVHRHLRVWMRNDYSWRLDDIRTDDVSNMTLVYDDDYTIPAGGTEEEQIALLDITLNKPFLYIHPDYLVLKIECTGETLEDPVYNDSFATTIFTVQAPVVYYSGEVVNQDGQPMENAHVRFYGYDLEYAADTDEQGHFKARIERGNAGYGYEITGPSFADYFENWNPVYTGGKDTTNLSFMVYDAIRYKKDEPATIILPTPPDPTLGRFYRFDRYESEPPQESFYYFEREETPQANVPYVVFPNQDFEIHPSDYDTQGIEPGSVRVSHPRGGAASITFVGSYQSKMVYHGLEPESLFFVCLTPDCSYGMTDWGTISHQLGRIGAFRAYFHVYGVYHGIWTNAPYSLVFNGEQTGIAAIARASDATIPIFDLQGRRLTDTPPRGPYIRDGKKYVIK